MRVRYLGDRTIEVIGVVTGAFYRFSKSTPEALVDPRDALALIRDSWFQVQGIVELPNNAAG